MKFAAAAAMASTSALAGNALNEMVHDKVFNYLGLTTEEPAHVKEMNALVNNVKTHPDVRMYGDGDSNCIDTDCNMAWLYEWNADVGYGLHFPMYAEEDKLIARQRASAIAGGRQHLQLTFYIYSINLYLDTYLANLTLDNFLSYDAINRSDFCYAGNWFLDIARIALLMQVDVKSCKHGVLGYLSDEISACGWTTYYIMKPLW